MYNLVSDELLNELRSQLMFEVYLQPEQEMEMRTILSFLQHKQIPLRYPSYIEKNFMAMNYRERFNRAMGFSLISEDWINPLARYMKKNLIKNKPMTLEIMAGSGCWAKALTDKGLAVRATDNDSWVWKWSKWTPVEKMNALDAIRKYIATCSYMLCSWAYMNDDLYDALILMRELNPQCKLIYIGESFSGCTANAKFFDSIEDVSDSTFLRAVSRYKKWIGLHDRVRIGK
jgi:hypothetical protein